jgi:hypothetical protein
MRRRIGGPQVLVGILFVIACILGRGVATLTRCQFSCRAPVSKMQRH